MKNKTMKELHPIEQPRERFNKVGVGGMESSELVALLIGSGSQAADVREIASRVATLYKEKQETVTEEDLKRITGVGPATAKKLIGAVEFGKRFSGVKDETNTDLYTSKDVWNAMHDLRGDKKEYFVTFFLNARNNEIKRKIISIGTINASIVHPREVFAPAVECRAATIIGVHNHPSGNSEPSDADLNVTRRLVEASYIMGIEFKDHVIVTKDDWYSIRDNHEDLFD